MEMQDVLVLDSGDVRQVLAGREAELVDAVRIQNEQRLRGSLIMHAAAQMELPSPIDQLFARPELLSMALAAGAPSANADAGSSPVIALQPPDLCVPMVVIERAALRSKRAGAVAALAASRLCAGPDKFPLGVVGCTEVNAESVACLSAVFPKLTSLLVFDNDATRAVSFARRMSERFPRLQLSIAESIGVLFASCKLVTIATGARQPHIGMDARYLPGATLLQLSRCDFSPEMMLMSRNVVDDAEAQCADDGSLRQAERMIGNRDFISCRLDDVLVGGAQPRRSPSERLIYTGQGHESLDVAVAQLAAARALATGAGIRTKADIAEKVLFVSRR